MRFVSVSDSGEFDEPCREVAGLIRCTGGTIASGESARVEIVVRPFEPGEIENTATVGVSGFENIDEDTEGTTVQGEAVDPDPTDPTDPTDPIDPTDPTDPTDPIENSGTDDGASATQYDDGVIEESIPDTDLPNTGGFPPLFTIGFFLVAGAGLGTALLRRRY